MSSIDTQNAILARIGDLMGPRATGAVTVASTDATGTLPARKILYPSIGGDRNEEGAVVVDENPDTEDGSWPITSAGDEVPVTALLGGTVGNLAEDETLRFAETIDGLEPEATCTTALTGGVDSTEDGAPKQVIAYKRMTRADLQEIFRAQAGRFPCCVVSWERTQSLDGPQAVAPSPRSARAGRVKMEHKHVWTAFLICSRMDGESLRRDESDVLRTDVIGQLFGAQMSVHGLRVSNEPGADIVDATNVGVTPTSFVDMVRFRTHHVQVMRRKKPGDYPNWESTRVRQQTKPQAPDPPLNLPDATIDMTPDE